MSLNLKNIALTGSSKSGQEYTQHEKDLAKTIATTLTSLVQGNDKIAQDPQVVEAVEALLVDNDAQKLGFTGIARRVYTVFEDAKLADSTTTAAFPKKNSDGERCNRDWTSIGLLFRGAMKEIKVEGKRCWTDEQIEGMFKAYWKKTDKKAV